MTFDLKKFNNNTVPKLEGSAVQVKGLERFRNFKATRKVDGRIITYLPNDLMIRYFFGCGILFNYILLMVLVLAVFDLITGFNTLQYYFGAFFR